MKHKTDWSFKTLTHASDRPYFSSLFSPTQLPIQASREQKNVTTVPTPSRRRLRYDGIHPETQMFRHHDPQNRIVLEDNDRDFLRLHLSPVRLLAKWRCSTYVRAEIWIPKDDGDTNELASYPALINGMGSSNGFRMDLLHTDPVFIDMTQWQWHSTSEVSADGEPTKWNLAVVRVNAYARRDVQRGRPRHLSPHQEMAAAHDLLVSVEAKYTKHNMSSAQRNACRLRR